MVSARTKVLITYLVHTSICKCIVDIESSGAGSVGLRASTSKWVAGGEGRGGPAPRDVLGHPAGNF